MPTKRPRKPPRKKRAAACSISCDLDLTSLAADASSAAEKRLIADLAARHAGDVRDLAVKLTRAEADTVANIVERQFQPDAASTLQAAVGADPYDRMKAAAAARNASLAAAGRDIGPLPPVVDPARREKCRLDLRSALEIYFPNAFPLAWSIDHLRIIGQIEERVLTGGLQAVAMPRGNGKSTIMERAVIWSALNGHHPHAMLIAANAPKAAELLDAIKTELECNDRLAADFPAAIYPIRCLERISNRAKGQTYQGRPTRIEWRDRYVVLPTIDGAASSAAILAAEGIESAVRGARKTLSTGEIRRPSLALIDDPSTRATAKSPLENKNRERIIAADVLGMPGPDREISALAALTIIYPDDLAARLLDRKLNPAWHGETTQLLNRFPTDTDAWKQYADILRDDQLAGNKGQAATAFYERNRTAMDAGGEASWPERHPGCASAIEFAMRKYIEDPETFAAEFQNCPLSIDQEVDSVPLVDVEIMARSIGTPRRVVPAGSEYLTAFADIHNDLIYFVVAAWRKDFTGQVIDYGTWPKQPRPHFELRKASPTIADQFPDGGLEARIYAAVTALAGELLTKDYRREDGADVQIDRLRIDAGYMTDVIYDAIANSPHRARMMPANGVFVGAKSKPFADYRRRRGDVVGTHWRIPALTRGRRTRYCLVDVNFWKSFISARLTTPIGDPGALVLFQAEDLAHRLFAEHLVAEYRVAVTVKGRTIDEWQMRPGAVDNHYFDCLVGAAAGANRLGAKLPGVGAKTPATKPIKLSDLQGR